MSDNKKFVGSDGRPMMTDQTIEKWIADVIRSGGNVREHGSKHNLPLAGQGNVMIGNNIVNNATVTNSFNGHGASKRGATVSNSRVSNSFNN